MWSWLGVSGIKYAKEILIVILLGSLFFMIQHLQSKQRKIHDLNALYKMSMGETEQWKDKEGKSRARAMVAEIDARNIKYVVDENLEALEKEIGSLKKNLISYSRISTVTQGEFKAPVRDTIVIKDLERIEAKVITFEDEYINFKQLIVADSAITKYSVSNDFEYYHYYRRPGKGLFKIFRRKEAVAEIKFKNPNTRGDSIYTLILDRKNKGKR